MDFYKVLGITKHASEEEARRAYREKVRATHPDTNSNPNSAIEFVKIQQAWEHVKAQGFNHSAPVPKPKHTKPKKAGPSDTALRQRVKKGPSPKPPPAYQPPPVRLTAKEVKLNENVVYHKKAEYTAEDLAWIAIAIANLRRDAVSELSVSGYMETGKSAWGAGRIVSYLNQCKFPYQDDEERLATFIYRLSHNEKAKLLDDLIVLSKEFSSDRDTFLFEYYFNQKHTRV